MRKYIFLAIGLIVALGIALVESGLLIVKTPTLLSRDPSCFNQQDLVKIKDLKNANLLNLNKQSISQQILSNYLCVGAVNFKTSFPNKLTIEVLTRMPVYKVTSLLRDPTESSPSSQSAILTNIVAEAQIAPSNGQFLVDQTGLLYSSQTTSFNSLEIKIFADNFKLGSYLRPSDLQSIAKTLDKIKFFNLQSQLRLIDQDWFILTFANQQIVAFNLQNNIEKQLASLQLILEQNKIDSKVINVIDLRFDKPILTYAKR